MDLLNKIIIFSAFDIDLALQVSKEFECENFKASNGWLDKFKSRYNISFKVVCGESKSVDTETVDEWRI